MKIQNRLTYLGIICLSIIAAPVFSPTSAVALTVERVNQLSVQKEELVNLRSLSSQLLVQGQTDEEKKAEKLNQEGIKKFEEGLFTEALIKFRQALIIRKQISDRPGEGVIFYNIGAVYGSLGQYKRSLFYYKQALKIYQEIDNHTEEGNTLNNIGATYANLRQYKKSISHYEQALLTYKKISNSAGEGITLSNLGELYRKLRNYRQALKFLNSALRIYQQVVDEPNTKVSILNNLAAVYHDMHNYQRAINLYKNALLIAQDLEDISNKSTILNNIGHVYEKTGKYQQAKKFYEQALEILERVDDSRQKGLILNNLGVVNNKLGDSQKALEYLRQALKIRREINDHFDEGITLGNIGSVYISQANYQEALSSLKQALVISKETKDIIGQGIALNNLGVVYENLGNFEEAIKHYSQALKIRRKINHRTGEAATLDNLASIYSKLADYQLALKYSYDALEILKKLNQNDRVAITLNNIGSIYDKLADYKQALKFYQRALIFAQKTDDFIGEGKTYINLAAHLLKRPDRDLINYQKITSFLKKALKIYKKNRSRKIEATILHHLGSVYQEQEITLFFKKALKIYKTIGNQKTEATILQNLGQGYYAHNLGNNQQVLEYYKEALKITREIVDLAGEGTILNSLGGFYAIQGDQKALEYYQQALKIRRKVKDISGEGITLSNIGFFYETQGNTNEAIKHYKLAIDVIESIQDNIKIDEFKTSFINKQIDVYERLIKLLWNKGEWKQAFNYIERSKSIAFLNQIGNKRINFRKGVPTELLEQERNLKAKIIVRIQKLTKLRNRPKTQLDNNAIAQVQTTLVALRKEYEELLTRIKVLSPETADLISVDVATLPQIQQQLKENTTDTTLVEFFVTNEGTLVFLITPNSFQTVTLDVSRKTLTQKLTLARDFNHIDNPHPEALKELHKHLIEPLKPYLKTKKLAIVPHSILHYLPFAALTDGEGYLVDDYAISYLPSANVLRFLPEKRKSKTNSILALGNPITTKPLSLLRYAQKEAKAVAKLFGSQALVRKNATESAIQTQGKKAEFIHLAAHGEYNPINPLSSTIYFAADKQNDGSLEVQEIFSLDLTSATNLVVLSACQTQVGKVTKGDDVVAMNRAFVYAGTPSVMASLWNVDDAATGKLMEHFYTHIKAGMSKAEALQKAQQEVRQDYAHPYFWAAFSLTGDGE